MKKIITHPLSLVVLLSLLPLWALFIPGLPLTHDGVDHVARIANFYQSLSEGNIIPRWAANLNFGYGHPILMFLYPLPSYLASAFHAIGFSLVDSVKIVFGTTFLISALTMYLWLSQEFGTREAILGTLLYQFAPYRFVDLYVRGDLGEHVAFIFPPLAMYFLLIISRSRTIRKRVLPMIGLSFSVAGLILAHNAIAIMFLPIIALYGLYLLFRTKDFWLFSIQSIIAVAGGFGISAFFWIPALIEGKYTLREIVTAGVALTRFVSWSSFIYSPWSYGGTTDLSKSIGILQWAGVIAAVILLIRFPKFKRTVFGWCAVILFILSLFIMTSSSAFLWNHIRLLQDFQFPWRFLAVPVFVTSVLGVLAVERIISIFHKKESGTSLTFVTSICILIVASTFFMWHSNGFVVHSESYYSGVYLGTTDTGESSPIWSIRNMGHVAAAPSQVISGEATILIGKRTTTTHEYTMTAIKPSRILENTLYFPGWTIYVDGVATNLQWQDPAYRGLMTYMITPGTHAVLVRFENTKLRKYSTLLTIVTVSIIVMAGISSVLWKERS